MSSAKAYHRREQLTCVPVLKTMAEGKLHNFLVILPLFLCIGAIQRSVSGSASVVCRENERRALMEMKQSLLDPSNRLSSWRGQECCAWHGVRCSNRTSHVTELRLRNPGNPSESPDYLGGEISPSLLQLKHLSYIDLSQNDFDGAEIPAFIGSFTNLRYLNLSNARFGGRIPHQLGNLTSLQYLDLHWIDIPPRRLVIDDFRWISHLSSLQYIDLSSINLETKQSVFDALSKLPVLSVLILSNFELSSIPATIPYDNLTSLTTLDLSVNHINSSIPSWMFNLSNLASIDLSHNAFHGPISGFGDLPSLKVLQLGDNYLNDSLPTTIGHLCQLETLDLSNNHMEQEVYSLEQGLSGCVRNSLKTLNLKGNQLSGELPSWLGEFRTLEVLYLDYNMISGSIPASFEMLSSSLRYLDLKNNKLTGPIPEFFGQFTELVVLDLSFNSLEGVVSDAHFTNTRRLEALFLSSNSFVVNMSFNWQPPFQLKNIHMDSCVLGPHFPTWLKTQRAFSTIDISNARISDTMPDWFWNMPSRVYYLNLSHNEITGSIPVTSKLSNVSIIDLRSNRFHGALPHVDYGVEYLYLLGNSFSGDLLPIANKKTLTSLSSILLSENLISGSIPQLICDMISLQVLDLSSNQLTGVLPRCMENFRMLTALNLANNSLSGDIPRWIGSLDLLMSLHLSNNRLHGDIVSLENCTGLYALDLGGNHFSGEIPTWFGEKFRFLMILRLRSNKFNGSIPKQLSGLTNLQVLDLADNELTGDIPRSLGNLNAMEKSQQTMNELFQSPHTYQMVDYFGIDLAALYEESLLVETKGMELKYSKTLSLVVNLDLSKNYLSGQIPEELMNLVGFRSMNLSENHFIGEIPENIGGMQHLESLDLSMNQLSGVIPPDISYLNSLSHLNLSYNNLSGRIPTGNQIQTLIDPTIYAGNPMLCGTPLLKKCPGDDGSSEDKDRLIVVEESDQNESRWLYLGIMVGFVAGSWGVWVTFLFKRSWRGSFFEFADRITKM